MSRKVENRRRSTWSSFRFGVVGLLIRGDSEPAAGYHDVTKITNHVNHGETKDTETTMNAEIAKIAERFDVAPQSGSGRSKESAYKPTGVAIGLYADSLDLPPWPAVIQPAGHVESIIHSVISVISVISALTFFLSVLISSVGEFESACGRPSSRLMRSNRLIEVHYTEAENGLEPQSSQIVFLKE